MYEKGEGIRLRRKGEGTAHTRISGEKPTSVSRWTAQFAGTYRCSDSLAKSELLSVETRVYKETRMSDDNSPVVDEQKKKRGRQAKSEKNAVKEPKKRGRSTAEKNSKPKSDGEDDAPAVPAKRGRGRPKGSHKKKTAAAKSSGRGRGRPKKVEEKPESTGEEEDEQEEEEEEEEN